VLIYGLTSVAGSKTGSKKDRRSWPSVDVREKNADSPVDEGGISFTIPIFLKQLIKDLLNSLPLCPSSSSSTAVY
jgi:hypothetical protein